jgi:hypothetical protein
LVHVGAPPAPAASAFIFNERGNGFFFAMAIPSRS